VFVEPTEKGDAFLDLLGTTILGDEAPVQARPQLAAVS